MCDNPVPFSSINYKKYKEYSKYASVKRYLDDIKVPCNNCLGCRLDKLAMWTARCNYEQIKGRNSFVTFTYDNFRLPYRDGAVFPTLEPLHLHKYIDNVRHKISSMPVLPYGSRKDFAYFCSGEYGDTFNRPHYHVLFFGLDFQHFKKFFESTWKNGMIQCLPIRPGGVRYVVDYFTKNMVSGELAEKMYDNKGLERPFKSCSRGLGRELFWLHRDEIRNSGELKIGSRIIPVPLYYKNLFSRFSDDEVALRFCCNRKHYDDIKKESVRLGYPDVDSYVAYIARSNELAYSKSLHDKGVANMPSFADIDRMFDVSFAERALS